jgi:hypothetical protein
MEDLHTKTFVIKNKKDERMENLHTKTFVVKNNNNKKDERMKSLHILKYLSSTTRRIKEWKFEHQTFCNQQPTTKKG